MRKLVIVTLLFFAAASAFADGREFLWKTVGGAPYKCAKCTVEWALANFNGMSNLARVELANKVERGNMDGTGLLSRGDRFDGVTFSRNNEPSIEHNVLADWPERKRYFATLYIYESREEMRRYKLSHVHACRNWTLQIESIEKPFVPPATPPWGTSRIVPFECPEGTN